MLALFATESVDVTFNGPVNVAPVNAAPPRFARAPEAVEAPVPPAVIDTVFAPDKAVPFPV